MADEDVSSMSREAWELVYERRLNVLLVGPEETTGLFLDTLRSHFREPVTEVRSCEPLGLPDAAHTGTLLVKDVGRLSPNSQRQLTAWLAHSAGRTQVISTSAAPVLPRIAAGEFAERLYYRLNTIYLDVTAVAPADVFAMNS
jgi:hypothetical protein